MADDRDSLLREVDEELRREQFQKVWDRYNGLIFAGAVAVVLAVAGYKFFETRRITAAEVAGADFMAAEKLSDAKKKDDADKAFSKIAETGPAGYAILAKFQLAGAEAKAGKTADAIKIYDSLAQTAGGDELLKNFAQLQAASLRLGNAEYSEMLSRLAPLAGDGAPYGASAKELLGVAAYKAKNYADARKYLEPLLIDPNSPQALQDRVKVFMGDIAEAEIGKAPVKPVAPASAAPAAPAPAAQSKAAPEKK